MPDDQLLAEWRGGNEDGRLQLTQAFIDLEPDQRIVSLMALAGYSIAVLAQLYPGVNREEAVTACATEALKFSEQVLARIMDGSEPNPMEVKR